MEKKESKQFRFGLIGRNISYSFSKGYFTKKFQDANLSGYSYENFDLHRIEEFTKLLQTTKNLKGINVTIPYKEEIIPFLTELDKTADKIGAVNTLKFTKNGLIGYNTDSYGFEKSLVPLLKKQHKKALILGTGGASKAVAHVLGELGISYLFVSRNPKENQISYQDLSQNILETYSLIINCSPLGTYPNIEAKPEIPYQHITPSHLLYDLIYNPEKTAFLMEGEKRGASIYNGLAMLQLQAEKAWEIWNS